MSHTLCLAGYDGLVSFMFVFVCLLIFVVVLGFFDSNSKALGTSAFHTVTVPLDCAVL